MREVAALQGVVAPAGEATDASHHHHMNEMELEIMTKAQNNTARRSQSEQVTNSVVEAAETHIELTAAPTKESITAGISAAIDGLASVFVEMELRRRGDNGKLYPINVDMPRGVEETGEVEMVNSLRSLQSFLTSTVCQRIELMLDFNAEKLASSKAQLRQKRDSFNEGVATQREVEVAQGWKENYEYQRALLVRAFNAAKDAHFDALGVEYETKAEREAAQRAKRRALSTTEAKDTDAHAARMARL